MGPSCRHLRPRSLNGFAVLMAVLTVMAAVVLCVPSQAASQPPLNPIGRLDTLHTLWNAYKYRYIVEGRVESPDEDGITTSEGQSYGLLRAVWSNDPAAFRQIWDWTLQNLRREDDRLFAWKYKSKVLDWNSASDADVDIALALLLASRRWGDAAYHREALLLLRDIWEREVVGAGETYFLTAGNWATGERYPTLHVAYFAPYAYRMFAEADPDRPWALLAEGAYRVWRWIYLEKDLPLPPEIVYLDRKDGTLHLKHPRTGATHAFGYDAYPLFWRAALDAQWFDPGHADLRQAMLAFFREEWKRRGKFLDRYALSGKPGSRFEGLPLYATVHALARVEDPALAQALDREKLAPLWTKALRDRETPYYLHNWLWFDRALALEQVRRFGEFLGFLRPLDFSAFSRSFPWALFALALALFSAQSHARGPWKIRCKTAFLILSFGLCLRYLWWRVTSSLNFLETAGPFISITLVLAEIYCFTTLLLLWLQTGTDPRYRRETPPLPPPDRRPTVDVYIPIYSESLDILEKTVVAASAMDYARKTVYVCDDSHRDSVRGLAESLGARYLKGPKRHAKAGNLNSALKVTDGDLVAVFDTDHIPARTFLSETVPHFNDPRMAVVQTPHHFYNQDIFQRAFRAGDRIPGEQDMFNHGMQGARDGWGGSFFVGSGALFRRSAMDEVGGFQLLSITEDIHTSQHLHARGWKSAFVDKDLAVGLTAENLSSYLVQRRRWMLGCLQIFFRDNPLLRRGLPWRQRLGYFASLFYFFHPAPRVIFWLMPLLFLLFHWHPIFSDVSVLLGHLVPYMILLPLISAALVPGWPRLFWGSAYENAVSLPLFRAMFDLLLPKKLGFKVTPKGIQSGRRTFDWRSSRWSLFAAALTVAAIGKGLFEFHYFGIEKDAYFFNLGWAIYNLFLLGTALLVAWERPQRRAEDRVAVRLPLRIRKAEGVDWSGRTRDVGLGGVGFESAEPMDLGGDLEIELGLPDDGWVRLPGRALFQERLGRSWRVGLAFASLDADARRRILLGVFAHPGSWASAHDGHTRSHWMGAWYFLRGIALAPFPDRRRRRLHPRRRAWRPTSLRRDGRAIFAWLQDRSSRACAVWIWSREKPAASEWRAPDVFGSARDLHVLHMRRPAAWLGLWRVTLAPRPESDGDAQTAALTALRGQALAAATAPPGAGIPE